MSESCNDLAGSEDHRNMLLPNHAKEIEQKLEDKSGSTRTLIDFSPNSTRVGSILARPIFGLCNASSTYQQITKSIYSSYEDSLDETLGVEYFSATASREAPVFDVYSDSDESSHDSLDSIADVLAKLQLKFFHDYSFVELLNNLQEVASIDDLPFQHDTPLTPYGKLDPGEPN